VSCADTRTALGAYVLGALDLDEHQAMRDHLAHCAQCREEYDQLAGIPSLLAMVTPEQAEQLADPSEAQLFGVRPSETGLHRLLGRVREERTRTVRRGRLLLGAAAAAVVFAIGGGVWAGGQLFPSESEGLNGGTPTGPTLAWEGENRAADVQVSAEVTPYGWGTRITMVMNGIEPGEICDFRVYDRSGREWGAGSWEVTEGHTEDVDWFGDVGVPLEQITRVELWEGSSDKRLVTWKL
jgi:Putative zinc-finger